MFFVIGPPGVFAGEDYKYKVDNSCMYENGRYLNLDTDSKNFTKCVNFGSRCAEDVADDCNKNGTKPLRCDFDGSRKCVEQKENGDFCEFGYECISHSCTSNTCGACSSDDDCSYYDVIGTRMDKKKYPCQRGKCIVPFKPY